MSPQGLLRVASALALGALTACLGAPTDGPPSIDPALPARPAAPSIVSQTGQQEFDVAGSSAVVYVPATIQRDTPVGLVLFLHGAGREVNAFIDAFAPIADTTNVIVLAPYANAITWDAIRLDYFSTDVITVEQSLEWVFARWTIDPAKIAASGFSDGATYALGLGRANGDLFARVVAYSPGFLINVTMQGRPRILISHGRGDQVLPFTYTKNTIVPTLAQLGYEVDFREFTGGHAVHLETARYLFNSLRTD